MGVLEVLNFNLKDTMESTQIFRHRKENGGHQISHGDRQFWVRQDGNELAYSHISKKEVIAFFRLDEDHGQIIQHIAKDMTLKIATQRHKGLRIIRQDPEEGIIAFLCSQMSNEKRIAQNLHTLASLFGKQKKHPLGMFYPFPDPTIFTDLRKLNAAKLGYRTKYLKAMSPMLTPSFLRKIRRSPYAEARERLMELPGIGEKVADCVLLYCFDKLEAFPVDVWVKRVIEEEYFNGKAQAEKTVKDFGMSYFGEYAGYAQQYLFHWRRMRDKQLSDFSFFRVVGRGVEGERNKLPGMGAFV